MGELCLEVAGGEVACVAFGEGAVGELCLGAAGGEVECEAFGEGAVSELCLGAAGEIAPEAFGDVAAAMAFSLEALDPCEKTIKGNGALAKLMGELLETGELSEVGTTKI